MDDELRDRLIAAVMRRDRMEKADATRIVNGLSVAEMIRLEMEFAPRTPAFTSEYDPYAFNESR